MPNTMTHGTSSIDVTHCSGGMVMRTIPWLVCAPALAIAAACGRGGNSGDDALKNDLALASQAQAYNPQFTPNESGYSAQNAPQYATPRAVQTVARRPVYSAPRRRSTSSASRSTGSNSGYYPAPSAPVVVEKHTQRDAAIGAAAGAVLGASTSRDKIKGGLIGAAVGGILGGVIGNNVDITRKPGGW